MSERSSVFILSVTPSSSIRTLLLAEIQKSCEDQPSCPHVLLKQATVLLAVGHLDRGGAVPPRTWNGQISEGAQASVLDRHVSFIHVLFQHAEDVRNHPQVQHLHTVAV